MKPGDSRLRAVRRNTSIFPMSFVHFQRGPAILASIVICVGLPGALQAADKPVSFSREVLPILSDKCFVCHGPDTRKKSELRLDSFEGATADRGGYRAIDPAKPADSEILKRLFDTDDPMPPEKAEKELTEGERETLKRWVEQGGNYTKHWAFVPPTREAGKTIDSLIAAKQRAAGVSFAKRADRATLARRAALILTGLPPEPEQLAAFMADNTPRAYASLLDDLLASPRYGEHQARYWLDAVRYGDTHGLHLDNRRGIFPYRDWVVKAFNDNLPFDKFILWQIAGDLLSDATMEQRIATGYVRMNPSTGEGGAISEEFQAKNNFDRVENLGTAFLGMSMNCARCHTHKYDPISQVEYYRMMAFFNNTTERALDGNAYRYGPVENAPENPADWAVWESLRGEMEDIVSGVAEIDREKLIEHAAKARGSEVKDWKWERIEGAPDTDQSRWASVRVTAPVDMTVRLDLVCDQGSELFLDGESRGAVRNAALLKLKAGAHDLRLKLIGAGRKAKIEVKVRNPWGELARKGDWAECSPEFRLILLADDHGLDLEAARMRRARDVLGAISRIEPTLTSTLIANDAGIRRETRLLNRGEYDQPVGEPLEPDVLGVMGGLPGGAPRNRLGLARWLVSKDHPVVARVLINRVWQRVYGHALVRSPEDFGLQGRQPTHPELLDWLAVEFQESGWDLKHMLRLMLASRTFQQDSAWRKEVNDPENGLFARGPGHRLDAEVLRDVALWAAGLLDPHMGGEGVKPWQPEGMWKALTHPASNTVVYQPDTDERVFRRSLYVYWKRTSPHPMMTLFDAPSRESGCVRRSRTNTALQSLGLFNEPQRLLAARRLAERLLREGDEPARLNRLYGLLACREPNTGERAACEGLLKSMRARYAKSPEDAKKLLGGASQLDPVEHAAWTQVANAVLASDAAILLY